jgi:hypothetical protein
LEREYVAAASQRCGGGVWRVVADALLQCAEFQAILDKAENTAEARLCKYRELSALAHDFVHASKTYGKIIVQESFLPRAYKTIKPGTLSSFASIPYL